MTATLVFDGACAFCTRAARRAARISPRLSVVAWQDADLDALGLTAEQCQEAVQYVDSTQRMAGAPAVAAVLAEGRGPWPLAAVLLRAPGIRGLADAVYQRVARRRTCAVTASVGV